MTLEESTLAKRIIHTNYDEKVIRLVSRKWLLPIVIKLSQNEKMRFNEIRGTFKQINSSILSSILKELENEKLIGKKMFNEIPPRVEYSITNEGIAFLKAVVPLLEWSNNRQDIDSKNVHIQLKEKS